MAIQGGQTGGGAAGAIRAGAAYVELFLQDNKLTRGLDDWRAKLGKAGQTLFAAGGATLGAGAAITAPLAGLAAAAVHSRVEMGSLAAKIGENVTTLSRFAYAAKANGISLGELEGHWENLSERILQAADGSGEASQAFQKLGINARSMIGMGRVEQMLTLADAFANVKDATTRNAIQSGLGGDQFQQLNSLFASGRSQIEKLMRESDQVGFTQTEEQTKRATAANLAWMRVKTAVTSVFLTIGDALIGPSAGIEDLADRIVLAVKSVRLFIVENADLIRTAFLVGATLVGVGAVLIGLGAGLSAAATACGVLKGAIVGIPVVAKALFAVVSGGFGLLMTPVGLFAAAVVGLGLLFFTQTDLGREWVQAFRGYFAETAANFTQMWGGIVDAIKAGDLQLAWQIVTAFLDLEWKRVWGEVKRVFREGATFFVDGWDSAVFLVKNLWIGLKEFVTVTSVKMVSETLRAIALVATVGSDLLAGLVEKVNPDLALKIRIGGQVAAVVAGNLVDKGPAAEAAAKVTAEAERKQAQAAFDLAKAAREVVNGVLAGNDAQAVHDAQQRLNDLTAQAAAAALREAAKKVSDGTRLTGGTLGGQVGTFSAFALANRFGGIDIPRRQLRATERISDKLDAAIDAILTLKGAVWQ